MCGIAAIVSESKIPSNWIVGMSSVIRHRGPDDEGYYGYELDRASGHYFIGNDTPKDVVNAIKQDNIADAHSYHATTWFGHRRLAIRDITFRGHQPMSSKCGRYVICYNGEIYNSDELRSDLEQKGYSFNSTTDTEVLIAAFQEWGVNCLSKFNGMFSLVLLDQSNKFIFVARDRFGIKPLYYCSNIKGVIAFASEIKQFTQLPGWKNCLNYNQALDFLEGGQTDHSPNTLFEGVHHVPPGHYSYFSIENKLPLIEFKKYYQIPQNTFEGNFEDSCERFKELFVDAVKVRLRSDVPVGTCLSGGLDSSSIVCVVNSMLEKDQVQKTFSSCSEHAAFDESEFIHEVLAKTQNVLPKLFNINRAEFESQLRPLVYHHDEPFLSPSVFAEWNVFKNVASEGVKVTLDGHGADEQLAGYHTFFGPHLYNLFKQLRWIDLYQESKSLKQLFGYNWQYVARKLIFGTMPKPVNDWLFRITKRYPKNDCWKSLYENPGMNRLGTLPADANNIQELSFKQLKHYSIPKQLRWCDRDSMGHSVESRVPFLDHRLVEFLASIPSQHKIHRGITKKVLRKGLNQFLPTKISSRIDKMGFVTPAELWIREASDSYKKRADEVVEKSKGILTNQASIRMKQMINGELSYNHSFWRMIFFAEWMDVYNVQID